MEDHCFFFQNNFISVKKGNIKICCFYHAIQALSITFLSQNIKLFSICYTVFDFFDLAENLIFVRRKLIFFHTITFANSSNFIQKNRTGLYDTNKCCSKSFFLNINFFVFVWVTMNIFNLFRNIKCVKNAVSLCNSKYHFSESCDVLRFDDPGDVDQFQLF